MQLKIQHKSFKINGKPRKIYPDNYPTLTIQFELFFITKQMLIENFLPNFFFNLSINEIHVCHVLKFNVQCQTIFTHQF